jgi:hypothetical protein
VGLFLSPQSLSDSHNRVNDGKNAIQTFVCMFYFANIFPKPLRNEIIIIAWILTALFWFARYQGHRKRTEIARLAGSEETEVGREGENTASPILIALAQQIRGWFKTLGYQFEKYETWGDAIHPNLLPECTED